MSKILIVDDNEAMCSTLMELFKIEGFDAQFTLTGTEAKTMINNEYYDLIITDLRLPDSDGIKIIKHAKSISPSTEIILITGFGSIDTAVPAIKEGAYDYLTKPFQLNKLLLIVNRALEKKKIADKLAVLESELINKYNFSGIIGKSEKILDIFKTITKVCKTDSTVLITGPSGTGKELIANAIHFNSLRKNNLPIIINCGAIPENLQESELFGHRKGSFTGAVSDKKGLFEAADGSTILLDEVGELSTAAQVTLLRVLQNNEIRRVGDTTSKIINVRVIALTNKLLKEAVKEGAFREDLYFRLNVIPIEIPPLKERQDDIPELADYFLKKYIEKMHKKDIKISRRAMKLLTGYSWPGNVRELENILERGVILCDSDMITPDDLPAEITMNDEKSKTNDHFSENITIADLEKQLIYKRLDEFDWNKSKVAKTLGITRATLLNKLKSYGE